MVSSRYWIQKPEFRYCLLKLLQVLQAQTRTVWRQATKFNLPSIFFINKMDKSDVNVDHVLNSIEEKLNIKGAINYSIRLLLGVLTVFPLYNNSAFFGFIDILNRRLLKMGSSKWEEIDVRETVHYLRLFRQSIWTNFY